MQARLFWTMFGAILLVLLLGTNALAESNLNPPDPRAVQFKGFKPLDPAAYGQAKAQAKSRAGQAGGAPQVATLYQPLTLGGYPGQDMSSPLVNMTPSDATGAAGMTEYIELVNAKIGVYNKSGGLLSSNSLSGWTGLSTATDELFDSQIIWDGQTNRFYYAMVDARNNFSANYIAWGYSKSQSPSANVQDWCHYSSDFGVYGTRAFPDYPKLGDSKYWLLVGVNRFNNALSAYLGSDIIWITKPVVTGTVTSCPVPGLSGVKTTLMNADGSYLSTPVPANQIDPSSAGWVLGTRDVGSGTGDYVTLYRVGQSSTTGAATFTRMTVALPADQVYSMPPAAVQAGTIFEIETMDGRITQAVSAVDTRLGHSAIWAQHTVAGGAGSQIDWFEIDTGTSTTLPAISQSGIVSHPSLYVFNGAISPDRVYRLTSTGGVVKNFGSAMALGFNTSSKTAYTAIQMVSKIGTNPQSGFTLVKQSPGKNEDFTCSATSPCRWGDYAGASPDPAASVASTAVTGQVWFSNQWNQASTDSTNIDWATWNWVSKP